MDYMRIRVWRAKDTSIYARHGKRGMRSYTRNARAMKLDKRRRTIGRFK